MTEPTFERRVHTWIEAGPSELPDDALGFIRAAIETVPQDRPPIRILRHVFPLVSLRAAAALVLFLVAGAAISFRFTGPDVANPRSPGDLLYAFPSAATVIERSGEAAGGTEVVTIGTLPTGRGFMLAGSCTGGAGVIARIYVPQGIQAGPSGGGASPPVRTGLATLPVSCDGATHHLGVATAEYPAGLQTDVELTISPGVRWRFAVGEFRGTATRPSFPTIRPADGWFALLAATPRLVVGELSLQVEVPEEGGTVAVLIQCAGEPSTASIDGGPPNAIACADPAGVARFEQAVTRPLLDVRITTAGATWVSVGGEVKGTVSTTRPTAPPLPDGLADVRFAESDGISLAFGRLGSNEQTLVHAPGAIVGVAGGDVVGVGLPDEGGGTRLELWSLVNATSVRTLARLAAGNNLGLSWVDATHGSLYYMVYNADFTAEWHRARLDGSGDRIILSTPSGALVAEGRLAIDDGVFVIDWCAATEGPCVRLIHDAASDTSRELALIDDRTCAMLGVVDGSVVALSGPTCAQGDDIRLTRQPLDGGPRRVLVEGTANGMVVEGLDASRLLSWRASEGAVTFASVALTGGTSRDLLTAGSPDMPGPGVASLRIPVGDWVLLAGRLADTFQSGFAPRPVPLLLNVITGDTIPLENLPHTSP